MAVFSITGDVDPFLHVSLKQGETLYCESDAMVTMDGTLELKGKMKGGLGSALMRTFANGESFFQQHIEASRGDGECLLAPTLPGGMAVVDCGAQQYKLGDGAFVAATSGIDLRVRTQSLGSALFGQSGGFFITETSGSGQVAIAGFGAMRVLDVTPEKEVIIDNAHVVCWDAALRH
ncbi:MAG TPA: AIM24 family protein, partial [Telluria sp.]|nr:AIM24 family protein [Telluria sp.]